MTVTIGATRRRTLSERAADLSRDRLLLAVLGIVLVAGIARAATVGIQSFDEDEAATIALLHMSLSGMLHTIPHSEQTPPLYYLVAWFWSRLFGMSEAGLRSLSVLAGTITVAAVFAAARELTSRRAAVLAAALAATNPLMFYYSQEARAYALMALWCALGLWLWARFLQRGATADLLGWAMLSALALGTEYFSVFLVAPQAGWLLLRATAGRDRRSTLAGIALPGAVGAALLPLALEQHSPQKYAFAYRQSLASRAAALPRELTLGYALPRGALWGAALALAALVVAWSVIRDSRNPGRDSRTAGWLLAAALAAVALVAPLILAVAGLDLIVTRNFLAVLVPAAVAVAAAAYTSRRAATAMWLVCLLWIGLVALVESDARLQRPDWRGVASALGPARQSRLVLVDPYYRGNAPLVVYLSDSRAVARGQTSVAEIDVVHLAGSISGFPQAERPLAIPAGFVEVSQQTNGLYSLVRLRARAAIAVQAGQLRALRAAAGRSATVTGQGSLLYQPARQAATFRSP